MEIDVSLRKCYYNNNLYDLKYLENEVRTMSSLDKQIDFTENSCKDFIDVLASSAPIPGGGGASALVGAIGVALGNMVGSLTVGKKRYADVEEDIIRCKKEADEIIKNTYRTLMTRGMKGCYVYCTDSQLSDYFKECLKIQKSEDKK